VGIYADPVPLHLYIDANVYLSLFHFSKDDLEQIDKLAVLVRRQEVRLLLPDQTRLEVQRNREHRIADSLRQLRETRFSGLPEVAKDFAEYETLRRLQAEYETAQKDLLRDLEERAIQRSLRADRAIDALFAVAEELPTTGLIGSARLRMGLGNPPGKGGSLGDALNWLAVLDAVPATDDLTLVSGDRDYASPLTRSPRLNEFLEKEWASLKGSSVHFYGELTSFFRERYPTITLQTELQKDQLIAMLASSSSFVTTHTAIGGLQQYEFTDRQAGQIVAAATLNPQVLRIIGDADVHAFLTKLMEVHGDSIDALTGLILDSHLHEEKGE
jgi:hypothetical protein